MNLVKVTKEVEINDKKYVMAFDMRSIPVFKQITGRYFLQSVAELGKMQDDVMLGFIAATIRESEDGKPLGKAIIDEVGALPLMMALSQTAIDIATQSMPQSKVGKKATKK